MSKTSFDALTRRALNGPTMATRWQALFWTAPDVDVSPVQNAMQDAVARVDAQMSLWQPQSDLCRLNAAAPDIWVDMSEEVMTVLARALEIGETSGGAFDIAVGAAVTAWGFGAQGADPEWIKRLLESRDKPRARSVLELDRANMRARKHAAAHLDLNGIAKGYGTDCLIRAARTHGIDALLAGIDGDLRACGTRPDGSPWPVAVEAPDYDRRAAHSLMELTDVAVATSGDYRHWVTLGDKRLSHTMNPDLGAPLTRSPASVTVLAEDCMTADAWATALMVLGKEAGSALAKANGIEAMFIERVTSRA